MRNCPGFCHAVVLYGAIHDAGHMTDAIEFLRDFQELKSLKCCLLCENKTHHCLCIGPTRSAYYTCFISLHQNRCVDLAL